MKSTSFLAFVVGAALCVETVHSMMCFTCENQRSNWGCLRLSFCPSNAQKCLTVAAPLGTGNERLITKMCTPDCPTLSSYSSSLYCCGHSWCNIWPPK
ncbi:lymphocyte antigen 6E-like [Sphaerodactylus townsendi]|uniref:lymphocyte antigen 6E-like n=1 Tax=Sphaerodactylus townsendi TaxID=933632 RepID=UPI002025DBCB|nr:lymphocyte antigen 6E-like [Sphaerodactylus townsendi]